MGRYVMSDRKPSERELKLTAAVYTRMGAGEHLRKTGHLPEKIGGPWNVIPMRIVIQERGTDLTLTPDEQLVYDAILRENRLPGGSVMLINESPEAERAPPNP